MANQSATNGFRFPETPNSFSKMAEDDMRDPKKFAAFQALRRNIQDLNWSKADDDFQLYRFLRAREFDLAKTELMLRNHLRWRKELRVDGIIDRFQEKEVITKYFPGGLCGHDKENRPLYFDPIGCIDPQGLAKSVSREDMFLSRIYRAEQIVETVLPQVRASTGQAIYGVTFIYDLQHFGRRHMWGPSLEFYGDLARTCEQNYPETIGVVFVINAPALFPIVYNLLKPLFNPATQDKIFILGTGYQRTLLQHIDADQLPEVYGGTRRDSNGDPRCSSMICYGGTVPESYYLQPKYPDKMQTKLIGRRSKFRVSVTVPDGPGPTRYIEWDFLTSDGDLGFELSIKDGKQRQTVLPYRKVNCGTCPFSGIIACPGPGEYEATFDNSFSWLRTKKLRYYLEVVTDLRGQEPIDISVFSGLAPSFHVSESFGKNLDEQQDKGNADGAASRNSATAAANANASDGESGESFKSAD